MDSCNHTRWLKLCVRNSEIDVEITDRPKRLQTDLSEANNKIVGLLMLIGNQAKQAAFKELTIQQEHPRARPTGEVHLIYSRFQHHIDEEILVVDTDIPESMKELSTPRSQSCHSAQFSPINSQDLTDNVSHMCAGLFHRTVFPFVNVICLFVEDLGGMERTVRQLSQWIDHGPPTTGKVLPHVILVINQENMPSYQRALRNFFITRGRECVGVVFHNVQIVAVPRTTIKNRRKRLQTNRRWRVLGHELSKALQLSRQARRRSGYLFHINHITEFMTIAARSVQRPIEPFNFIAASRIGREVSASFPDHLANFIDKFESTNEIIKCAIPVIASSFLIDHYVPGMHLFDAHDVFSTLYHNMCHEALAKVTFKNISGTLVPSELVRLISCSMFTQYAQFQALGSSREWHLHQLETMRPTLSKLYSSETCLTCLQRRTQYRLGCGHSICLNCIKTFFCGDNSDSLSTRIEMCYICGSKDSALTIRLIPETCLMRVLCFDGGGIRGSAPIAFLKAIERAVGIPGFPVQQHFDLKFGTSSGALSVMALDILGWNVDKCMGHLKRFASAAFQPNHSLPCRMLSKVPVISAVSRLFCIAYSVLTGYKYSADGIEQLLQETYGRSMSINDTSAATETGSYVGLTLTDAQDGRVFVATNYNESGQRPKNCVYQHLISRDGEKPITWWEAQRGTTAAPYYFKPIAIGDRVFQDGGLAFNNPASIAVQEAVALSPDGKQPCIVLSLGTGYTESHQDGSSQSQNRLRDTFPVRVSRAVWRQVSSKSSWEQLLSHSGVSGCTGYYRHDVGYAHDEPHLDQVDMMDGVARMATDSIESSDSLTSLALDIHAKMFYLEINPNDCPLYSNGAFRCTGHIFCRVPGSSDGYEQFIDNLVSSNATFHVNQRSRVVISQNTMGTNFRIAVKLSVTSTSQPFNIQLSQNKGKDELYHINGSPFTLDWLMRRQGLSSHFGTGDHRKRGILGTSSTRPTKRNRYI